MNIRTVSYLTCLTHEGKLEDQFGESGYVYLSDDFETVYSCTLSQDNSHFVVCGSKYSSDYTTAYAAMANYKDDGSVEIGFNRGDPVYASFSDEWDMSFFICGQQLGSPLYKTTVLGKYMHSSGIDSYQVVARFLANGSPDPNFGGEYGVAAPPGDESFSSENSSLTTTESGRLLIAGSSASQAAIFAYSEKF